MCEVKRYEALDGKLFLSETDCLDYEKIILFLDHKEMEFYSLNGKRIKHPNESVFINKHYQLHNNDKYKKSDGITIHMVGTGIGTCYTLECPVCHETEDITDVAFW